MWQVKGQALLTHLGPNGGMGKRKEQKRKRKKRESFRERPHLLSCNIPKYTISVFYMFRVFCKHKLNFRKLNAKIKKLRNPKIGQVTKAKV